VREVNSPTSTTHRMPNTYEPSTSAQVAQWLVKNILTITGIIVAALVALFIHYDGKTTDEAKHEKTNSISEKVIHETPKS